MSNQFLCVGASSHLGSQTYQKMEPTKTRSCPSSPFQQAQALKDSKLKTSAPEVRSLLASHSAETASSYDNQVAETSPQHTGNDHTKPTTSYNLAESHRIRNYQIKLVRKGLPDFSFEDEEQVMRLMQKRTDLRIVPYWVCQRGMEYKSNAFAWVFSITVTCICVLFPLMSFSSDVAFYVTCSDHYNHTSEILQEVRAGKMQDSKPQLSELNNAYDVMNKNEGKAMKMMRHGSVKDGSRIPFERGGHDDSSCEAVNVVIKFMMSENASINLERHRHITIDIFEPVFILGSFPSLILCILTRLVILVTGHRNFLSAFVMNLVCMPLQLITGALSVHSASYHLGKTGFECWHCARKGDCSDMQPLWWLYDGLTKILLVSVLTKILDGFAGGLVLLVVIIRRLQRNHVRTYWQSVFRITFIFVAFILCCSFSPIMVITPAMMVMRLEFMELATPFHGREAIQTALTVLMTLGVVMWSVSFGTIVIYIVYNMCLYCRERATNL